MPLLNKLTSILNVKSENRRVPYAAEGQWLLNKWLISYTASGWR